MTRQMLAIIGGPAYRMEVDARHAGSMVELAMNLRMSGHWDGIAVHYEHATPVSAARNSIFRKALESPAQVLVWADSDVSWTDPDRNLPWVSSHVAGRGDVACILVPVACRNGNSNILVEDESDNFVPLTGVHRVSRQLAVAAAGGLGLAIFNLSWYRSHWPVGSRRPWFTDRWEFPRDYGAAKVFNWTYTSEDIDHTSRVPCQWGALVETVHHARGGDTYGTAAG